MKTFLAVLVVAAVAFAAGYIANPAPSDAPIIEDIKDIGESSSQTETRGFTIPAQKDFVPANVTLLGSRIALQSGCYAISFQVTDDQAFSIRNAIDGTMSVRPLTHDILKDVLGDFDIKVLNIRIERFAEDIYYARMFVQQGGKVLDLDLRPSDAIALSLRTKSTLYINASMIKERGDDIC